jgi:RNA polymerase sigma factor (sigma-70 family)
VAVVEEAASVRGQDSTAELVRQAKGGDERAWQDLVDRYARLVWSVCRNHRLADADAADVSQTVWLRLVEHLPQLRDPAALPSWLVTTAKRECLRVVATTARRWELGQPTEPDRLERADEHTVEVDQMLLAEERAVALRAGLAELDSVCQELLRRLAMDPPQSYKQISLQLGRPVGSIGPTRERCLKRLRRTSPVAALIASEKGRPKGGEGYVKRLVDG